jgi:flagellar basal-body rod modification protein FlgD
MSSINSLASVMNSNTNAVTSQDTTNNPNAQLTPSDFINFMVTELQNQDPLDPTDPNQMLQQMSEIGQLQSQDTLQTDLTGMVQQNQVSSAATMIGKQVTGTDTSNNAISGIVTGVQVNSTGVSLQLNTGSTLAMGSVTAITNATSNTGQGS